MTGACAGTCALLLGWKCFSTCGGRNISSGAIPRSSHHGETELPEMLDPRELPVAEPAPEEPLPEEPLLLSGLFGSVGSVGLIGLTGSEGLSGLVGSF